MADRAAPLRVLHVISGLETGGAERSLVRVVRGLRDYGVDSRIVAARSGGGYAGILRREGFDVIELGMRGAASLPGAVRRLRRVAAAPRPDIVQGWMYHGNLLAALAVPAGVHLLFGIRHSLPTLTGEKLGTRIVIRVGARFAARADAVIYNSRAAIPQHVAVGYPERNAVWIANGFDTDAFRPDAGSRQASRLDWGGAEGDVVIGLVGRYHPVKNHELFMTAAASVASRVPASRFLVAGPRVTSEGAGLVQRAQQLGILDRCVFRDQQADVPRLMNGLDLLCLTSTGEGLPNVVGEAMACGVPVVATDVGDVAALVGECGRIVPRGDRDALVAAVVELAALPADRRDGLGAQARRRIVEHFSEASMLERFAELYRRLGRPAAGER